MFCKTCYDSGITKYAGPYTIGIKLEAGIEPRAF
jgi:hypothetical protein